MRLALDHPIVSKSTGEISPLTHPAPHASLTLAELRAFIRESTWIFAKTMPECPHEYTLRRNASDETIFERFVIHIRHHGYKARYKRNLYTYFDVDEWQYWTMGAPLKSTILINRAKVPPAGAAVP
jgi:hypothetical protein